MLQGVVIPGCLTQQSFGNPCYILCRSSSGQTFKGWIMNKKLCPVSEKSSPNVETYHQFRLEKIVNTIKSNHKEKTDKQNKPKGKRTGGSNQKPQNPHTNEKNTQKNPTLQVFYMRTLQQLPLERNQGGIIRHSKGTIHLTYIRQTF